MAAQKSAKRKLARPQMLLLAAVGAVLLCVAGWGAYHYMFTVPGTSHQGALPALTPAERTLAGQLKTHIATIAAKEHNIDTYDELEKVAQYIERTLTRYGYKTAPQQYTVRGKQVRNIEATIEAATPDAETIVVGAHYDSAQGTPGANDNASGTAAVIELARLLSDLKGKSGKRIRLVLFVNEEPPYFAHRRHGQRALCPHACRARRARHGHVFARNARLLFRRARQPEISGAVWAFCSLTAPISSRLSACSARATCVQDAMRSFRSHTQFPTHRRRVARLHCRHRLVGSPVLRQEGFPGADDHGHGAVPLSALSRADRHAGQDRQRTTGARGQRHRARGARPVAK